MTDRGRWDVAKRRHANLLKIQCRRRHLQREKVAGALKWQSGAAGFFYVNGYVNYLNAALDRRFVPPESLLRPPPTARQSCPVSGEFKWSVAKRPWIRSAKILRQVHNNGDYNWRGVVIWKSRLSVSHRPRCVWIIAASEAYNRSRPDWTVFWQWRLQKKSGQGTTVEENAMQQIARCVQFQSSLTKNASCYRSVTNATRQLSFRPIVVVVICNNFLVKCYVK